MICSSSLFFFNDTATTEIYTLSLHDALPIAMSRLSINLPASVAGIEAVGKPLDDLGREPCDRLAIVKLGLALGNVGRRREAAAAQLSFSAACGGHVPSLKSATSILLDLSDS